MGKLLKIVVDDKIPFLQGVLEPFAEVVYLPGSAIQPVDVRNAQALLVRTRTDCDAALLDGSAVEFIGTATIGFDHIDIEYCTRRELVWARAPGCNAGSVNQWVVAALLEMAVKHSWDLQQLTLGVIGVGHVGSQVVASARALGMTVLCNDPPRARAEGSAGFCDLEQIRRQADVLTFHVPLIRGGEDRTYHWVNSDFLRGLKPGAWVLNSSRGAVIVNRELREALHKGTLGGAVLDVWEGEPDLDRELLGASFLGTPHIAGYSQDGKANATTQVVRALAKHFGLQDLAKWAGAQPQPPQVPRIAVRCSGLSREEVLHAVVRHTYSIRSDDALLRAHPEAFEVQRGAYPPRREFAAYTPVLAGDSHGSNAVLQQLGFAGLS